jgi:hypothetical protein
LELGVREAIFEKERQGKSILFGLVYCIVQVTSLTVQNSEKSYLSPEVEPKAATTYTSWDHEGERYVATEGKSRL